MVMVRGERVEVVRVEVVSVVVVKVEARAERGRM